jgi:hypothetical protein
MRCAVTRPSADNREPEPELRLQRIRKLADGNFLFRSKRNSQRVRIREATLRF